MIISHNFLVGITEDEAKEIRRKLKSIDPSMVITIIQNKLLTWTMVLHLETDEGEEPVDHDTIFALGTYVGQLEQQFLTK